MPDRRSDPVKVYVADGQRWCHTRVVVEIDQDPQYWRAADASAYRRALTMLEELGAPEEALLRPRVEQGKLIVTANWPDQG